MEFDQLRAFVLPSGAQTMNLKFMERHLHFVTGAHSWAVCRPTARLSRSHCSLVVHCSWLVGGRVIDARCKVIG